MAALLALASALGWGSSDFAAGVASRRSSAVSVVILTHLVAVLVLAVFVVDVPLPTLTGLATDANGWSLAWTIGRPGWRGAPTTSDVLWGAAAGVSGGIGALLLYRGLARGAMAVVAPITAAGAAAVPAVWGLLDGEPVTAVSAGALALGLVAIVLVSSAAPEAPAATVAPPAAAPQPVGVEERLARVEAELADLRTALAAGGRRRADGRRADGRRADGHRGDGIRGGLGRPGVAEALLSGLGFGGFYVFLDGTGAGAGLWPLVAARAASVMLFVVGALVTATAVLPARGTRRSVLAAGVLDAAAAVSFLAATRSGLLSVVAVLSSLYPGVTVLLARLFTHERMVSRQLAGLGCAGAAIALFALG